MVSSWAEWLDLWKEMRMVVSMVDVWANLKVETLVDLKVDSKAARSAVLMVE